MKFTDLLMVFALGFAPGIYWLSYFYKKDWLEPEPKGLLIRAFVLGILSAIVAAIIESLVYVNMFLAAVAIAPIVEESCKLLVLVAFIYPRSEFDEPMDGIVYGAAVALGFASIENVFYLIRALAKDQLWYVFVVRSLISVPCHALFTIVSGFALGLKKNSDIPVSKGIVIKGLVGAIVLHSVFNASAGAYFLSPVLLLILVYFLWKSTRKKILYAQDISPFKSEKYWKRR